MRKLVAIIFSVLTVLSLTACESSAELPKDSAKATSQNVTEEPTLAPTQEPTQAPTEPPTTEPEPIFVDHAPFAEGGISYYKYAWGTSFDEIKKNEIKPGMIEGQHYGYYDSGLNLFAKELVVDDEIKGLYFVTRLDFDWNNQLVSVMPVLEEYLSDRSRVEIYLDLVAQCKELYGDPERITGLSVNERTDIDQFTQSVLGGANCTYIWSDADRNQVVVSCQPGQGRIDVIVIFNTKDYRM